MRRSRKHLGNGCKRLLDSRELPPPLPMRNAKGAIVYYLFFASQVEVAEGIVRDIFAKYKTKGEV